MRGMSVMSAPSPMMPMNLPQPSEPFAWAQVDGLPALVCAPLAEIAPHLFTTRAWALGSGSMGNGVTGDDLWAPIAEALDVTVRQLIRVRQVHGTMVVVAHDA